MIRLTKLITLFTMLVLLACNSTPKESNDAQVDAVVVPDGFYAFLDQFHADSTFQLAHIRFPLQGVPSMMAEDVDVEGYRWVKEGWVMHKGFDPENDEFEQTYKVFSEDMVVEQIIHINGQTGMERRFSRSDDSWDLIYYAAMNVIRK